jgi:two-component system chemotaxis response regulator CheB
MNDRHCDVIGIGTSAGGVNALLELLPLFQTNLPASIFVVLHRHPTAPTSLVDVLARSTRLRVKEPHDGDPLELGVIYLAPRDRHMTVKAGRISLNRQPRQHHSRPAIDPLFQSLAAFKKRTVGVLLTGTLADGVSGLLAIKAAGGVTVAQDPMEAMYPTLPLNAIRSDDVDRVLTIREIAPYLESLARGTVAT